MELNQFATMSPPPKKICIVVLGDIGRSPRMQYHSLSAAEHGHKVDVVGYRETQPVEQLLEQPLVSFHYLPPYPTIPCPRFINYVLKTVWQVMTLLFVLAIIRKPDVILVQNPPAVPALLVCWFHSVVIRAKLIIDWHNYAHTIMGLNVGGDHVLVKITKKVESLIGVRATNNFCVSNAMKEDLAKNWSISAVTLYDRPPDIFQSISLEEKHELISCLGMKYTEFLTPETGENTVFTERNLDGTVVLRSNRPGLLISSTSWTEDEDFSLLFSSLNAYEEHIKDGNIRKLPPLICVITGKGPLKKYYAKKIEDAEWNHIKVITPWLESKDYPRLLACADLGVCLHTSSSGLDLPMKVIDMFGCSVPVCAYDYECLDELVKHGVNSYKFKTSDELSQQLQDWFEKFPNNDEQNSVQDRFKTELQSFQNTRWRENWDKVALPIILE